MTKVTGNVSLRLVKPFNVKTDKMFAEVFASISSHPSQPVRTRSAYKTDITHIKSVSVCLSYSEIACHLFSIRKTW